MRKHTPRKPIDPTGCITRRLPPSADQQQNICLVHHISLQGLLTGHGSEQGWGTVSSALNTALILAERGIASGAVSTIQLAQDAMMRAHERAGRTGKWGLDGDGIRATQAALLTFDEQVSRATREQLTAALTEVRRRVEQGEVYA